MRIVLKSRAKSIGGYSEAGAYASVRLKAGNIGKWVSVSSVSKTSSLGVKSSSNRVVIPLMSLIKSSLTKN